MEWMLLAAGVGVVVAVGLWRVRRGSGDRLDRSLPQRSRPRATPGIEDSMSVRLPTGGNSGA